MQTDALIQRLSDDLTPVFHDDARTRIGAGLLAGAASSLLLLLIVYGLRSDLDVAVKASAFWIKLLYTLTLGAGALLAALRLGRPGTAPPRWTLLIAPPVIGLATATAVQLNQLPAGLERTFWYGATWLECPLRVFLLSLPVLAGLIWSLRYLAVTRSREAGAAVGLAAGAIGATIYALHCSETSAGFVLVWYSVGLALCSGLGAVLGPRVFRW
jgi:hypothetical protein